MQVVLVPAQVPACLDPILPALSLEVPALQVDYLPKQGHRLLDKQAHQHLEGNHAADHTSVWSCLAGEFLHSLFVIRCFQPTQACWSTDLRCVTVLAKASQACLAGHSSRSSRISSSSACLGHHSSRSSRTSSSQTSLVRVSSRHLTMPRS